MDPHSFFADPDPALFLNADPDPAAFSMRIHSPGFGVCCKSSPIKKSLLQVGIDYQKYIREGLKVS